MTMFVISFAAFLVLAASLAVGYVLAGRVPCHGCARVARTHPDVLCDACPHRRPGEDEHGSVAESS